MVRILHLSDLHFGFSTRDGKERSTHEFVKGEEPDPAQLARILAADLGDTAPHLVVASGDLTWAGSSREYTYAQDFFARLRAAWPEARITVAPGNHDVNFSKKEEYELQAEYVAFCRELYRGEFNQRFPFLPVDPNQPFRRPEIVSIDHVPDRFLIVAVNTAAHAYDVKGMPVFIQPEIIERIQNHIDGLDVSPSALRVFVMHHHALPFTEFRRSANHDPTRGQEDLDKTIVSNTAHLQAWLDRNRFHLLLHGHKHVPHGRKDTLWRSEDEDAGLRLLVVGAGSAGVERHHRDGEPLGYNVIHVTRMTSRRWRIAVSCQRIDVHSEILPKAKTSHQYRAEVGRRTAFKPHVLCAERMVDCHAAIAAACSPGTRILNFVSVVEDSQYQWPETASMSADHVTKCFLTLHPEWDQEKGRFDASRLDELRKPFRFQHGHRLFQRVGESRPIEHAVDSLVSVHETRAYVGLYDPASELSGAGEPAPALVGIQFVPDGAYLDAVATFRNLELSFWWVVNMLEVRRLLEWAASKRRKEKTCDPRRITFFSAIAEWRPTEPRAPFLAKIDEMSLETLAALVIDAMLEKPSGRGRIRELVHEKRKTTNEFNLDGAGLDRLASLLAGQGNAFGKASAFSEIATHLRGAANAIRRAVKERGDREELVQQARAELDEVITRLAE